MHSFLYETKKNAKRGAKKKNVPLQAMRTAMSKKKLT